MAISFDGIQKYVDKANGYVTKVTRSSLVNKTAGILSQVTKRIATPQDLANVPDALKTYQWEAIFPGIDIPLNLGSYVPICENVAFDWPTINTTQIKFGPYEMNVPVKKQSGQTFSASFYCDMNMTIQQYFESWRKMIISDDQILGFAEDYKKRMYLYILGFRSVIPVYLIKFKGIYPTKITGYHFDSKSGRQVATITFSCDAITGEALSTGQAITSFANNLAGNLLTKYGSVSAIAGQFM